MSSQAGGVRPSHIGQIAINVKDIERATAFYRDVLGLEHLFSAPPGLSFFRCGEVRLMLSKPEKPDFDHPGSILYYSVDDVDIAHGALVGGGAEVEGEPHVVHRTDSTELWMGFYRDPEDNLFATMSEVSKEAAQG